MCRRASGRKDPALLCVEPESSRAQRSETVSGKPSPAGKSWHWMRSAPRSGSISAASQMWGRPLRCPARLHDFMALNFESKHASAYGIGVQSERVSDAFPGTFRSVAAWPPRGARGSRERPSGNRRTLPRVRPDRPADPVGHRVHDRRGVRTDAGLGCLVRRATARLPARFSRRMGGGARNSAWQLDRWRIRGIGFRCRLCRNPGEAWTSAAGG